MPVKRYARGGDVGVDKYGTISSMGEPPPRDTVWRKSQMPGSQRGQDQDGDQDEPDQKRKGGMIMKKPVRHYDGGGYVQPSGGGAPVYVGRDTPVQGSRAFSTPVDLTPPTRTAQADTDTEKKRRGGMIKKPVKGYQRGGFIREDTAPGAASASSHRWSANIAGRDVSMKNKGGKVTKTTKGKR